MNLIFNLSPSLMKEPWFLNIKNNYTDKQKQAGYKMVIWLYINQKKNIHIMEVISANKSITLIFI